MRARAIAKGIPLTVDVDWRPDRVSIVGLPQHNDPANTAAHVSLAATQQPWTEPITITFPGYNEARARVGWLRSAYLVAFALMGYRYVLQPEITIVRQQIQEPDAQHITRFSLHRGEREPLTGSAIAWLTHPRSLESVVVVMGDHWVFLPGLKRDRKIYERLELRRTWPPRRSTFRSMRGVQLTWPSRPGYGFD